MMRKCLTYGVLGLAVAALSAPDLLHAQEGKKRLQVHAFDQMAVTESVNEVFGGSYDLGNGLAELVRKRLKELGLAMDSGQVDGRVEGIIVFFGKESGRGEAAGVSVGGVRVGLGRKREVALVMLEARLTDVTSGQMVTMVTGQAKSDKGGWDVAAQTRGGFDLASLDLSGDAFRKSAIGDATHKAVDELAKGLRDAARKLGTFAAPAPVAAAPAPMPERAPVSGGGAVGSFGWVPYQFKGTEHFRYDVRQTDGGQTETGYYQLDLEPAGQDRVRLKVAGRLGEEAYSSTVTTGVGADGMQMGMGQFMTLGPIGIVLFNPFAWMTFAGRELTLGDGWSYTSEGETFSAQVERQCAYAGQSGLMVVMRENNQVRQESCISKNVPLPLRVMFDSDGEIIEMTLASYRP